MTGTDFLALTPWLLLTVAALAVMLTIAFYRLHSVIALLSAASLGLTLLTIPFVAAMKPRHVTPLFVVDGLALFVFALSLIAALAVTALAYPWLARQRGPREEFYLLILLATLGAGALVASTHYASLLLGLETLSVALFALAAYPIFREKPLEAGVKYLILAGISVAFLLFGAALIYARTGGLALDAIASELANRPDDSYLFMGVVLVLAGLAFKLSLVPFHLWTPDVYEGAPPPVTAFLATVSKGAVIALLLRYLLVTDAGFTPAAVTGLTLVGLATMLAGNLLALLQSDLKRLLAYSSMGHMGYLVLPLMAGGDLAVETIGYYLVAYFIMTLIAFGVVTLVEIEAEDTAHPLERYQGLMWRRPWLAASLASALFALAGMPLTVGFVAKFYLFVAGVDKGVWLLLAGLILGSAIGLFYYLRVIIRMVGPPAQASSLTAAGDWPARATLMLLMVLLVLFGIYPTPIIAWVRMSAQAMLA